MKFGSKKNNTTWWVWEDLNLRPHIYRWGLHTCYNEIVLGCQSSNWSLKTLKVFHITYQETSLATIY